MSFASTTFLPCVELGSGLPPSAQTIRPIMRFSGLGDWYGRSDSPASLRQSACRDFDSSPLTPYIAAMCGRFTQHYMWEEIHDLYELTAAKPPTNMRPR